MESLNFKINKKSLICLSSILALSLLVILFINLTPSKKNISTLNKISLELENYNKNFDDLINSNGFDTNKVIDTLNNSIVELDSIKNSINSIDVEDENIKNALKENINYNSTINSLCISLLKNPQDKDFNSKYGEYIDTYNMLLDNYSSLNSLGMKIEISDSAKNFFEYTSKYFNTLISLSRDMDIKTSQKNNYISNLEDCIESFDKIDEDLEPALNQIRKDNRSLDVLIKDVRDKKSTLNEIKNTSYCISIPENGNECFNLLQDTINYYELYITSLEHSLIIEKTSSFDENKKNIEENYENSFSKFTDFKDSLANLRKELDNFNKK